MNRGFANIAIIVALIVLVAGAGWWYMNKSSVPTILEASFKEHQNDQLGINARIPSDWTVSTSISSSTALSWVTVGSYTHDLEKFEILSIQSPDFKLDSKYPDRVVASGMDISISAFPIEGRFNESIWDPEAYLTFEERLKQDCSNCISYRRINFGGEAAILTRAAYPPDWFGAPNGEGSYIELIHNRRIFNISFGYVDFSAENEKVISEFIEGFEFTQ